MKLVRDFRQIGATAAWPDLEDWTEPPKSVLMTAPQAAERLGVTVDQLLALVHDGELKHVNMGRGSKRPRYRFTPADLDELIERRTTREATKCQSIKPRRPGNSTTSISKSTVIGFTALREAQIAKRRKR